MGTPKASLELSPGIRMGCLGLLALQELLGTGLDRILVMVHPEDPLVWLPRLAAVPDGQHAGKSAGSYEIIPVLDHAEGMAASIRCGLQTALSGAEGTMPEVVLIALADQPFVTSIYLRILIEVHRETGGDYTVGGTGDSSVLSPPAILSRSMFPALLDLRGDTGARKCFACPEFKGTVIPNHTPERLMDVDTPEDLIVARAYWAHDRPWASASL